MNHYMQIIRGILITFSLSVLFSCDAPRLNPVDPLNPDYKYAQLEGYVLTSEIPHQPITDANIYWKNGNRIVKSDSTGYYKMEALPMENGFLYFEKVGFKKDSVFVEWRNQKNKKIDNATLFYSDGNLDGYVYTNDIPNKPISKAKVLWKNSNKIAETNSSGYYKFENMPIKEGTIIFEADGFYKDSLFVNWGNQKTKRVENILLSYNLRTIEGFLKTEATPNLPLNKVKVFWKNQSILKETDANGYFKIENITNTNGFIYFEKDGYLRDSLLIQWGTQKSITVNRFLYSLPKLEEFNVSTEVLNVYSDAQKYSLSFYSKILDLEKDIDSVVVSLPSISYRRKMNYNPDTKKYEYKELNLTNNFIDGTVGKNFNLTTYDKRRGSLIIGTAAIKRLLTKVLEFISPANKEIVDKRPTLKWKRYDVGFNFKYKVSVYANEFDQTSYWERTNISKEDIELTMPTDLPVGDYYWVIWCIDDFENSARSKPASFSVR